MASKAGAKKKKEASGNGAVPLGQFPGFPSWAGTATRIKKKKPHYQQYITFKSR